MALDIQGQTWIDWMHASTPLIINHREMIDRGPRVMPLKLSIFLLMELSNLGSRLNKCSYRSMEVKPPALLGNYDRPTDRPTNQPTDWQDLARVGMGQRKRSVMCFTSLYSFGTIIVNCDLELTKESRRQVWVDKGNFVAGKLPLLVHNSYHVIYEYV